MYSSDTKAYVERAVMHEQLAAATADAQARKMHESMADAYRRKAGEAEERTLDAPFQTDRTVSGLLVGAGL